MILASIFRDSATYVDRYVEQVKALRELMPVRVVAVEGDSTDDTYDQLLATDFTRVIDPRRALSPNVIHAAGALGVRHQAAVLL